MAWEGGGLDSHFFSKHNRWVDLAHLTNSPHEWSDRGQVFASPQWPRQSGEGGDWSGCFTCRYPPPPPPPHFNLLSSDNARIQEGALHAVTALTPPPPSPSPQFQFALFWQITDWRGCFTCRYRPHPPPPPSPSPQFQFALFWQITDWRGCFTCRYRPPPPPPLPHQPPFQSALFWQCTNSHKGAIYIWTNFITWQGSDNCLPPSETESSDSYIIQCAVHSHWPVRIGQINFIWHCQQHDRRVRCRLQHPCWIVHPRGESSTPGRGRLGLYFQHLWKTR